MVRSIAVNTPPDFLQRKLDHYNAWLLDPKRPVGGGTPYPGFPEEIKMAKAAAAYKEEFIAKREAKAKAAPKAKAAKKVKSAPTKQDLAVAIYQRVAKDTGAISPDKGLVISAIQAELGMSLAGATTYYYNSKKLA